MSPIEQGDHRPRGIADPHVSVVPIEFAPDSFRKGGRRGRHDTAGRGERQELQRQCRTLDRLPMFRSGRDPFRPRPPAVYRVPQRALGHLSDGGHDADVALGVGETQVCDVAGPDLDPSGGCVTFHRERGRAGGEDHPAAPPRGEHPPIAPQVPKATAERVAWGDLHVQYDPSFHSLDAPDQPAERPELGLLARARHGCEQVRESRDARLGAERRLQHGCPWQPRGQGFDSPWVHHNKAAGRGNRTLESALGGLGLARSRGHESDTRIQELCPLTRS